jgi:hypothetical protein
VGASVDASGFLLASEGMLTASNSRSLFNLLDPQVKSVLGLAISFLIFILLFPAYISRGRNGRKSSLQVI